jgi:hypothetical protein
MHAAKSEATAFAKVKKNTARQLKGGAPRTVQSSSPGPKLQIPTSNWQEYNTDSKGFVANCSCQDHKPTENHIVKRGKKFRLLSHKGKNLGTFSSKGAAAKHEGEVEWFKTHPTGNSLTINGSKIVKAFVRNDFGTEMPKTPTIPKPAVVKPKKPFARMGGMRSLAHPIGALRHAAAMGGSGKLFQTSHLLGNAWQEFDATTNDWKKFDEERKKKRNMGAAHLGSLATRKGQAAMQANTHEAHMDAAQAHEAAALLSKSDKAKVKHSTRAQYHRETAAKLTPTAAQTAKANTEATPNAPNASNPVTEKPESYHSILSDRDALSHEAISASRGAKRSNSAIMHGTAAAMHARAAAFSGKESLRLAGLSAYHTVAGAKHAVKAYHIGKKRVTGNSKAVTNDWKEYDEKRKSGGVLSKIGHGAAYGYGALAGGMLGGMNVMGGAQIGKGLMPKKLKAVGAGLGGLAGVGLTHQAIKSDEATAKSEYAKSAMQGAHAGHAVALGLVGAGLAGKALSKTKLGQKVVGKLKDQVKTRAQRFRSRQMGPMQTEQGLSPRLSGRTSEAFSGKTVKGKVTKRHTIPAGLLGN